MPQMRLRDTGILGWINCIRIPSLWLSSALPSRPLTIQPGHWPLTRNLYIFSCTATSSLQTGWPDALLMALPFGEAFTQVFQDYPWIWLYCSHCQLLACICFLSQPILKVGLYPSHLLLDPIWDGPPTPTPNQLSQRYELGKKHWSICVKWYGGRGTSFCSLHMPSSPPWASSEVYISILWKTASRTIQLSDLMGLTESSSWWTVPDSQSLGTLWSSISSLPMPNQHNQGPFLKRHIILWFGPEP